MPAIAKPAAPLPPAADAAPAGLPPLAPTSLADTVGELQMIDVDKIFESELNPRQHYDATELEELTASIRERGILQPLKLRPMGSASIGMFEIAGGHRRHRGAKKAGLLKVPALVKPMSDADFLEYLVIENSKHVNVHPLEEADGYARLMKMDGYSPALIAQRVSRPVVFVTDRLRLLQLTKRAQKLYSRGAFTLEHAKILSRLSAADQDRAMEPDAEALFTDEASLWDPTGDGDDDSTDPMVNKKARSPRELQAWVDTHVRFVPEKAAPELFPEAAAAVSKAITNDEQVVHITFEHRVSEDARDANGQRTYGDGQWKRADGKEGSKVCEHAALGVVVAGPRRTATFRVCVNKKGCKTHWAAEQKQSAKRVSASPAVSAKVDAKAATASAKRAAEQEQWEEGRMDVLKAVAKAVQKQPIGPASFLRELILDNVPIGATDEEDIVPEGRTSDEFVRYLAYNILLDTHLYSSERFGVLAKSIGLDAKKVLAAAAPSKPDPKKATAKSAAKKKTAKKR